MASVEMLKVNGDTMYRQDCFHTTWQEGCLLFYHADERIFCAVYRKVVPEKPIRTIRVTFDLQLYPRLEPRKEDSEVVVCFRNKYSINFKGNRTSEKGSVARLHRFLCDIKAKRCRSMIKEFSLTATAGSSLSQEKNVLNVLLNDVQLCEPPPRNVGSTSQNDVRVLKVVTNASKSVMQKNPVPEKSGSLSNQNKAEMARVSLFGSTRNVVSNSPAKVATSNNTVAALKQKTPPKPICTSELNDAERKALFQELKQNLLPTAQLKERIVKPKAPFPSGVSRGAGVVDSFAKKSDLLSSSDPFGFDTLNINVETAGRTKLPDNDCNITERKLQKDCAEKAVNWRPPTPWNAKSDMLSETAASGENSEQFSESAVSKETDTENEELLKLYFPANVRTTATCQPYDVTSFYSRKTTNRPPLTPLNTNFVSYEKQKRPLFESIESPRKRQKQSRRLVDVISPIKYGDSSPNLSKTFADSLPYRRITMPRALKDNGEVGFTNIGNSCYMNSVLQCLLHVTCFTDDLRAVYSAIEDKLPELSITRCLMLLMSAVQNEKHRIRHHLGELLATVCRLNTFFCEGEQQDAQEFLFLIIQHLIEESEKIQKSTNSPRTIGNNFLFQLSQTFRCSSCSRVFQAEAEEHLMLSVDIPPKSSAASTLQLSLDNYFSSQEVELKCIGCQGKKTTRQQKFLTVPRILVLHLQRYSFKEERSVKLDSAVGISRFLTVKEFVEGSPTVNMPSQRVSEAKSPNRVSKVSKSPRKDLSPITSTTERESKRRFFFKNARNPIGMKGGGGVNVSDGQSDIPADDRTDDRTDDELLQQAIEASRQSFAENEDKAFFEAVNESLRDQLPVQIDESQENEMEIDLQETMDDLENATRRYGYQLVGVVNHVGCSVNSGHYMSYVHSTKNIGWFDFNDDHIRRISLQNVLQNSNRNGYLFFYVAREVLNAS